MLDCEIGINWHSSAALLEFPAHRKQSFFFSGVFPNLCFEKQIHSFIDSSSFSPNLRAQGLGTWMQEVDRLSEGIERGQWEVNQIFWPPKSKVNLETKQAAEKVSKVWLSARWAGLSLLLEAARRKSSKEYNSRLSGEFIWAEYINKIRNW